jgi:hypothetical protein
MMEISKEIFDREIGMCRKLFKEKAGCNWGRCESCGVIPLLIKLSEGVLIEDVAELERWRKKILEN